MTTPPTVTAFPNLRLRPLQREDQPSLWEWLHIALWDPPPATLRPREVLDHPAVRIYAEDWGKPGDMGVVAEVGGAAAGACWMRLLREGVGLAYVDERTPQLGIALLPVFQRKAIGAALMAAALRAARDHGYPRVSLTVHPRNPAIALYERCGFAKRGVRNGYDLMIADL
ncbi:MAG TPA: GNAT family N-acetyltransferase [Vicinamibacterales bacterium]